MSSSRSGQLGGDTSPQEDKYKTVIRLLLIELAKSQKQLGGLRELAKICRKLETDNEKLKERSMNYEIGMTRAERRAAQLQEELYRLKGGSAKVLSPTATGGSAFEAPAFLPSSIKGLIDSLTNENVRYIKALNSKVGHPKGAELIKKNQEMQEMINRLREELSLRSQLIDQLKIQLESYPETNAENEAELGQQQQQNSKFQEQTEQLERKVRSYQVYVKQLRDKNSHLLKLLIENDSHLAHDERQATESDSNDLKTQAEHDVEDFRTKTMIDIACQTTPSVEGKLAERQVNQAESKEINGADVETGADIRLEEHIRVDANEMQTLRDLVDRQNEELKERDSEKMKYEKLLSDLTRYCETLKFNISELENDATATKYQLDEERKKAADLQEFKKDSEMIISEMQRRVDQVNELSAGRAELMEKLEEYKKKSEDVEFMQDVLSSYENQIKAYGSERNEFVQELDTVKNENQQLLQRLTLLQQEVDQGKKLTKRTSSPYLDRTTTPYSSAQRPTPKVPEPWQGSRWNSPMPAAMMQVAADGGRLRADGGRIRADPDNSPFRAAVSPQEHGQPYKSDRSALQEDPVYRSEYTSRSYGQDTQHRPDVCMIQTEHGQLRQDVEGVMFRPEIRAAAREHDQFHDMYEMSSENTILCENCGEKYPSSLFEDHLRDCGM